MLLFVDIPVVVVNDKGKPIKDPFNIIEVGVTLAATVVTESPLCG